MQHPAIPLFKQTPMLLEDFGDAEAWKAKQTAWTIWSPPASPSNLWYLGAHDRLL